MGNLASLEKNFHNISVQIPVENEESSHYPCIWYEVDRSELITPTPAMIANNQVPIVIQMIDCVKNGDLPNFTKIVDKCLSDPEINDFADQLVRLFDDADFSNNDVLAIVRWVFNHPKIPLFMKSFSSIEQADQLVSLYCSEMKMEAYVESIKKYSDGCNNKQCPAENCPEHARLNILLMSAIRRNMPRPIRALLGMYHRIPLSVWFHAVDNFNPVVVNELLAGFPTGVYDPSLSLIQMNACINCAMSMPTNNAYELVTKIYHLILVGKFDEAKQLTLNDARTRRFREDYLWYDISDFLAANGDLYDDKRHYNLHCWFIENTNMLVNLNVIQIDKDMFHRMSARNLEKVFVGWNRRWMDKWYVRCVFDAFYPASKEFIPDEYLKECINRKCSIKFLKNLIEHVGKERFMVPDVHAAILKSTTPAIIALFGKK